MAVNVITSEEFQKIKNGEACQPVAKTNTVVEYYFSGKTQVFSNFYEFRLNLFNRIFTCAEAAYQYSKAVFYNNWDLAEDIAHAKSGLVAKALSHSGDACSLAGDQA